MKLKNIREATIWAYRLFLDREPESEAVIKEASTFETSEQMRNTFIYSKEFLAKERGKMPIYYNMDRIDEMLKITSKTWEEFGKSEPFFSVLTSNKFRQSSIDLSQFYATGKHDVEEIFNILDLNDIDTLPLNPAWNIVAEKEG